MKTNSRAGWSGWKNKAVPANFALLLLGTLLAGCPGSKLETSANQTKITLRGSNTIGEELAPKLIAAYREEHADVGFDMEFKGTGYGLGALSANTCDIAGASRSVTSNELDILKESSIELKEVVIGTYAVAVVVNAENPVGELSQDQVRGIFTGEIQNWKDIGGPDVPIHRYIRNPVSGTYLGFQELALADRPYAHVEKALKSYAEIIEEVRKDPAGIGYSSPLTAEIEGVKAETIGGVAPTAAEINKGGYPYAKVLRLYTNKARETTVANDFIQFILSPRGQEVLAAAGFVPKQ